MTNDAPLHYVTGYGCKTSPATVYVSFMDNTSDSTAILDTVESTEEVPAATPVEAVSKELDVDTAHVAEIYSSIQGEGPYVGCRQIFVRFYGCHLKCAFCDTPETVTFNQVAGFRPSRYRFEQFPGGGDFETQPNPCSLETLRDHIVDLDDPRGLHHSVAITGGEPLIHARYLAKLFPMLRDAGMTVYLETSGDLVKMFNRVSDGVDIVAMDIKLPSVTHDEPRWDLHRKFLSACMASGTEVFAKIIVSEATDMADVDEAAAVVAECAPDIPLIIQPLTPMGSAKNPPTPAQLLEWHRHLTRKVADVRVIPQTHKFVDLA